MGNNEKRKAMETAFNDALKPLMGIGASLLENPTEADLFRVDMIQRIMKDLGMMRDCLLDTFDVDWEEYKKQFAQKFNEALKEQGA